MYYISMQASIDTVMREADLAKATVVDWANFVREVRVMRNVMNVSLLRVNVINVSMFPGVTVQVQILTLAGPGGSMQPP